jgi:hypothetical protein
MSDHILQVIGVTFGLGLIRGVWEYFSILRKQRHTTDTSRNPKDSA